MSIQMEEMGPLKLYFIHFLAAGHMIPLCDIATLFASRGHNVTIITTPSNAQVLRKSIPSHPLLRLHAVHFPSQEAGLPDGIENISSVEDAENLAKMFHATAMLQPPIEEFVEQHPPDCIVADFLFPWVDELANKLCIPRLAFNGFSLFTICAVGSPHEYEYDNDSLHIPTLPHPITINATPPKELTEFLHTMLQTELKSHGLIVNSFLELDGEEYIGYYEKSTGHKAWHLGPASLIGRSAQEKAERGQKSVVSVEECLTWLDSKRVESVVYICFGSLCHFPDKQLQEIACGIEASGHEFIWVVPEKKGKENERQEEKEKWLPKGFEEKEKGMIIRGWAPQLLILNHHAVGAFLTHCGWNSTVEAVTAGIPMLTWPVHGEQFYNEKLITQVRGIGVEVGAAEWTSIGFGERHKLVTRDSIQNAITRLMDAGDEATQIRRRAKEFAQKARKAVKEGGSSHNNLTALIHDLKRLRDAKLL
ncbi:scopoletin glucosyltransferase [Cajanus cajan]|uniref:scopoletin glucosyltransferase n=1 Tax=Cajanus cajan TaxID=3821 RepID=UPI00098DADDA|nr:scopoletin glucosyltransferase [Cajanus cajan]